MPLPRLARPLWTRALSVRFWLTVAAVLIVLALLGPRLVSGLRASRPAPIAAQAAATLDHPWSRLP